MKYCATILLNPHDTVMWYSTPGFTVIVDQDTQEEAIDWATHLYENNSLAYRVILSDEHGDYCQTFDATTLFRYDDEYEYEN